MNKKALFCDGTSQYVNPSEPERNEEVVFRFRTAKDRRAKYLTIMR